MYALPMCAVSFDAPKASTVSPEARVDHLLTLPEMAGDFRLAYAWQAYATIPVGRVSLTVRPVGGSPALRGAVWRR